VSRPERNTSDHCKFCDQPRFQLSSGKLSALCIDHQREAWRDAKKKNRLVNPDKHVYQPQPRKPRPVVKPIRDNSPVCAWCGNSQRDAAFAAINYDSWCGYCTPVHTPLDELVRRRENCPEPAAPAVPERPHEDEVLAILIDGEMNTLQQVRIEVVATEPLPAEANLRKKIVDAYGKGIPVIRKHQFTHKGY
jgi:hypothetical protein